MDLEIRYATDGELTGSEMNQENIVALATGSQASPARRAIQ